MSETAADIQERALRNAVADALTECTEKQRAFFHRIYGERIPASKLPDAWDLVQRTIRKNEAGR
jgi:hypothetical protein